MQMCASDPSESGRARIGVRKSLTSPIRHILMKRRNRIKRHASLQINGDYSNAHKRIFIHEKWQHCKKTKEIVGLILLN